MKTNSAKKCWNNGYDNVITVITMLINSGKINKTDTAKFETVSHRYYRYYNDGDHPRTISRTLTRSEIEEALEKEVVDTLKYIWKKYVSKLSKNEMKKFSENIYNSHKNFLIRLLNEFEIGSFHYYLDTFNKGSHRNVMERKLNNTIKSDTNCMNLIDNIIQISNQIYDYVKSKGNYSNKTLNFIYGALTNNLPFYLPSTEHKQLENDAKLTQLFSELDAVCKILGQKIFLQ